VRNKKTTERKKRKKKKEGNAKEKKVKLFSNAFLIFDFAFSYNKKKVVRFEK